MDSGVLATAESDAMFMKPRCAGFSLIELLTVIAILALLIGLVFPVVSASRKKARQAACETQLHQLGQAFQMYLQDWRDEPVWFSATSTYAGSRELYLCPSDYSRGQHLDTEHHQDAWRDPYMRLSYFYDWNPLSYPDDFPKYRWQPSTISFRNLKELEHAHYGDEIPVLRCWWHGRRLDGDPPAEGWVINLTYGGSITRTPRMNPVWQQDERFRPG